MQVYYKCLNAKNGQSTLYPALGFELVISRTWVSSRNQLTTSSDRFIWFEKFLYRTSKQLLQWNSLPMCLDKAQLVTLPGHYLYLHRTFLPTSYLPTYIVPTYLHRTYVHRTYLPTYILPTYIVPTTSLSNSIQYTKNKLTRWKFWIVKSATVKNFHDWPATFSRTKQQIFDQQKAVKWLSYSDSANLKQAS